MQSHAEVAERETPLFQPHGTKQISSSKRIIEVLERLSIHLFAFVLYCTTH